MSHLLSSFALITLLIPSIVLDCAPQHLLSISREEPFVPRHVEDLSHTTLSPMASEELMGAPQWLGQEGYEVDTKMWFQQHDSQTEQRTDDNETLEAQYGNDNESLNDDCEQMSFMSCSDEQNSENGVKEGMEKGGSADPVKASTPLNSNKAQFGTPKETLEEDIPSETLNLELLHAKVDGDDRRSTGTSTHLTKTEDTNLYTYPSIRGFRSVTKKACPPAPSFVSVDDTESIESLQENSFPTRIATPASDCIPGPSAPNGSALPLNHQLAQFSNWQMYHEYNDLWQGPVINEQFEARLKELDAHWYGARRYTEENEGIMLHWQEAYLKANPHEIMSWSTLDEMLLGLEQRYWGWSDFHNENMEDQVANFCKYLNTGQKSISGNFVHTLKNFWILVKGKFREGEFEDDKLPVPQYGTHDSFEEQKFMEALKRYYRVKNSYYENTYPAWLLSTTKDWLDALSLPEEDLVEDLPKSEMVEWPGEPYI